MRLPENKRHQYSDVVLRLFNQPSSVVVAELDLHDPIICYLYGLYHGKVVKDYDLMMKYFEMAAAGGNVHTIQGLGHYYYFY